MCQTSATGSNHTEQNLSGGVDEQPMIDSDFEYRNLLAPAIAYRVQMILLGIVFPLGCFLSSASGMESTLHEPWQSGRPQDYVAMLLKWPGYLPFLPLVLFSQICFAVWIAQESLGARIVVRWGIYSGFLLSTQFLVFTLMTSALVSLVGALLVFPGLMGAIAVALYLPRYIKQFSIKHLLILTAAFAILIATMRVTGGPGDPKHWLPALGATIIMVWQTIVMATPTLCTIVFARASIQVADHARSSIPKTRWSLTLMTWLATWAVSWKLAVNTMLEEYAKLPASNPNCYVSSAAANGHRWLVRTNENSPVNRQMRRLKFLELVFKAALPRCHQFVRMEYDRLGPLLARACGRNVWIADMTYVWLKPLELVSELVRWTTGVRVSDVDRIYPSDNTSS